MCLNIGQNKDVLKLMKASGCKGIFVGLESVSKESLASQNKGNVNIVDDYKKLAKNILSEKIVIVAATMYGFDQDTEKTLFKDTLKVLTDMAREARWRRRKTCSARSPTSRPSATQTGRLPAGRTT